MPTITLWHNPQCSKSRNALELLNKQNLELTIVKYLDEDITYTQIEELLDMLNMKPRDLMRQKEEIYKTLKLKDEIDNQKLIEALVLYPKLIERPIVIKDSIATIGRPIENIIKLLES